MKILNSQLLLTQVILPHCSAEIVVCVDSVFLFIYEDSSRDLMIAEREEIINPMIVGPTPGAKNRWTKQLQMYFLLATVSMLMLEQA